MMETSPFTKRRFLKAAPQFAHPILAAVLLISMLLSIVLAAISAPVTQAFPSTLGYPPQGLTPAEWGDIRGFIPESEGILAPLTFDSFGFSVAADGNTIVVGAYGDDACCADAGAAYVFERDQGGAGSWGEVTKLTASDAAAGDEFGVSVAISGDTIVVGARFNDGGGSDAGAAYVFEHDQGGAGNWGEVKKLTASDAATGDEFGGSAAISGNHLVVGSFRDDDAGADSGAAYVFERDQGGAG
ncbi:MAG: hypothetical protein ACE5GO_08925, partial [Anaerolineales bacterium]